MMEEEPREKVVVSGETMQIGKSRPPLPLTDLPEPEEVFKIKGRIGTKQLFLYVLGPSMIALGVSIGSGEWLVGPRTVGGSSTGFIGIGWIVLVSAILQVFYNVELGRFTLATGEARVVAFGRVPPGFWLWTPLSVVAVSLKKKEHPHHASRIPNLTKPKVASTDCATNTVAPFYTLTHH